ncbi:MAG TPA: carcinine hydrolase/isopenicillin-N N-acyltransferase family protein, partial [Deltaproteobacteria bacterium]|nr:carcinine hydrolase/isopenicillin-N N-acyltransferase family protein [Deltaproteobacteria bacterium]
MCDTFGALPSWTGTGIALFGKNSDREPDEAQLVTAEPRRTHPAGDMLKCTYISIPQARKTHALLYSRPFWMWGAEMGVNEQGVAIGNEAIFTTVKQERRPGLIGMDLVRLALERAQTAREAADVICALLAQYGQSGPCGYRDKRLTYMNSFLIMDAGEILVLETLGRDYALKAYGDHAAISNAISLDTDWDAGSFKTGTNLKKLGNSLMTYFAGGRYRRLCSMERIMGACGRMDIGDAFALLRSHNDLTGFNRDVCMQAHGRLIRRSQTTSSLVVASLRK